MTTLPWLPITINQWCISSNPFENKIYTKSPAEIREWQKELKSAKPQSPPVVVAADPKPLFKDQLRAIAEAVKAKAKSSAFDEFMTSHVPLIKAALRNAAEKGGFVSTYKLPYNVYGIVNVS